MLSLYYSCWVIKVITIYIPFIFSIAVQRWSCAQVNIAKAYWFSENILNFHLNGSPELMMMVAEMSGKGSKSASHPPEREREGRGETATYIHPDTLLLFRPALPAYIHPDTLLLLQTTTPISTSDTLFFSLILFQAQNMFLHLPIGRGSYCFSLSCRARLLRILIYSRVKKSKSLMWSRV